MKRNCGDFLHIPAFADGGGIHVVVETPRGKFRQARIPQRRTQHYKND
jgi:hypothetical protein